MKRFLSSPFFLVALIAFFLPFFAVTCQGQNLGDLGSLPGVGAEAAEAEDALEATGVELVTGEAEEDLTETEGVDPTIPEVPGIPGIGPSPGATPAIPSDPTAGEGPDLGMAQIWAIAAAALALLGIFLSLLGGRAGGAVGLVLGAGGAGLLFLLKSEFTDAVLAGLGSDAGGELGGQFGAQLENIFEVEPRLGFWLAMAGFGLAAVTGLVRLLLPDRPGLAPPASTGFGPPPAGPPPAGPPPSSTPPPAGQPPVPPGPPPAGTTPP